MDMSLWLKIREKCIFVRMQRLCAIKYSNAKDKVWNVLRRFNKTSASREQERASQQTTASCSNKNKCHEIKGNWRI